MKLAPTLLFVSMLNGVNFRTLKGVSLRVFINCWPCFSSWLDGEVAVLKLDSGDEFAVGVFECPASIVRLAATLSPGLLVVNEPLAVDDKNELKLLIGFIVSKVISTWDYKEIG